MVCSTQNSQKPLWHIDFQVLPPASANAVPSCGGLPTERTPCSISVSGRAKMRAFRNTHSCLS